MLHNWMRPLILYDTDDAGGGGENGSDDGSSDEGAERVAQLEKDLQAARDQLSKVNHESQDRRHKIKELQDQLAELQDQASSDDSDVEKQIKTLQRQLDKANNNLATATEQLKEHELTNSVLSASRELNLRFQSADAQQDATAFIKTLLEDGYTSEQVTDALKQVFEKRKYYFVTTDNSDLDGNKRSTSTELISDEEAAETARRFGIRVDLEE